LKISTDQYKNRTLIDFADAEMGRRADHSRDELHAMALEAARELAERDGLRGLTARGIMREIGYSIGTFYQLFENFDALILRLNGATLDDMYEFCSAAVLDGKPEEGLNALARRYIRFTRDHPKRWSMLFEHRLPDGRLLPDWHHEKVRRLLGLAETALAPLFPPDHEAERLHSARVLWSSLHGLCSLESANKLVESESVEALSDSLITNYVRGLRVAAG